MKSKKSALIKSRVLYISYLGLMEPLGQSQILEFLLRLAPKHRIALITYEKRQDWQDKQRRNDLIKKTKNAEIIWVPLRYHKTPPLLAKAYDLLVGFFVSIYLIFRYHLKTVHSLSYVPAIWGLFLKLFLRRHFIFDNHGFWPDERIDGGIWKKDSYLYRLAKFFEIHFFTKADVIVCLTRAGMNMMQKLPYLKDKSVRFELVTTCINFEKFYPLPRKKETPFTVGYVGTVGTWYMFDVTLKCFNILKKIIPEARLVILNKGEHAYINQCMVQEGIPRAWVEIKAVARESVPEEMSQMDVGIFFIKPVFSKIGSSPTKLGEFLGCGIPCLSNAGVGDVEEILEKEKVGVALMGFSQNFLKQGVLRLLELKKEPDIKDRCVRAAHKYYLLEEGVITLDNIYKSLS